MDGVCFGEYGCVYVLPSVIKLGRQGLSDEAEDAQWPAPLDDSVPIR